MFWKPDRWVLSVEKSVFTERLKYYPENKTTLYLRNSAEFMTDSEMFNVEILSI